MCQVSFARSRIWQGKARSGSLLRPLLAVRLPSAKWIARKVVIGSTGEEEPGGRSVIVRLVHAILAPSVTGICRIWVHEDDSSSVGIIGVDRFGDVT